MNIKGVLNWINSKLNIEKYFFCHFPAGHYYSPIPSISYIKKKRSDIFSMKDKIKGVDLNDTEQLDKVNTFQQLLEEVPFYSEDRKIRFDIENDFFSYDDAVILHLMTRALKPKRIIEVGSGFSSACMLDTSDMYFNSNIDFTFIDIDCQRLKRSLKDTDYANIEIIEKPVQEVDLNLFKKLEANDILLIDSSHVVKTGSDLTRIFFDILPELNSGVCIHFHDIRFPFQYQESLIMQGIYWNEAYFLQTFLQYNDSFKITFWLNYLVNHKSSEVRNMLSFLPLDKWDKRFNESRNDFSEAGGSIYLTKS